MLCDTSTQQPQASAGRCRKGIQRQRHDRKPPHTTKAVNAKWRTTRASASNE